jgi:N-acetylated-alpha-linked acidic dipeptidase
MLAKVLSFLLSFTFVPDNLLRGYSAASSLQQRRWEEKMRQMPDPARMRQYMEVLSAEPHHVGSEQGRKNAEYILERFRSWGLKAEIEEFEVLFPTPRERSLEMLEPTYFRAGLQEPPIPEDPDSADRGQLPTYNAYSIDGDVVGQLVYVNYGMPADYEQLERMGVDVRGKIVIARYGGGWRGIKPKVAHERGAIGCIIYSDPREDGYFQGDVYPQGPYRPEYGVQRGSVMDSPLHPGDPLTPGWGSKPGARRIRREESDVITKIPVLPISYGDALPLLRSLRGPVAPESWRGALPITYHIGPGPARVRLKVSFDWSLHKLYNVIARIEGSAYRDEWIIYGNHHDAWVNGAVDPISGMVTVMEVGRALGELLTQGWRPKRTILLCAWDGEEPSLLGSTEWVETHAEELKQKAVAYLNSDSTTRGWLNAGGSHTLERFINDIMKDVIDPKRNKSVWEALRARRLELSKTEEEKRELAERADLRIEALGSGSDYTAFLDHIGIASLNIGFGGEAGYGVYHSIYDSLAWYTRFGDPTFEYCKALAQIGGTAVMRLACADVLPFEFTNLADALNRYADDLEKLIKKSDPPMNLDLGRLRSAIKSLVASARHYERALAKATASGFEGKRLGRINQLLYTSERALTSQEGLPRRPWFRHLIYAPGLYTGYAAKTLPGAREAIEQKLWHEVNPQMERIIVALGRLASQIDEASRLLEGK